MKLEIRLSCPCTEKEVTLVREIDTVKELQAYVNSEVISGLGASVGLPVEDLVWAETEMEVN